MPLVAADWAVSNQCIQRPRSLSPKGQSTDENGSATRNMPESAWDSGASARRLNKRIEITVFVKKRWPGYCPGSARGSVDWRLRHGQYAASRFVLE